MATRPKAEPVTRMEMQLDLGVSEDLRHNSKQEVEAKGIGLLSQGMVSCLNLECAVGVLSPDNGRILLYRRTRSPCSSK